MNYVIISVIISLLLKLTYICLIYLNVFVKKLELECDYIELGNYVVYNYSLAAFLLLFCYSALYFYVKLYC